MCGCPEPGDVRSLTGILICDGFVIGETLNALAGRLLGLIHQKPFHQKNISFKGELRDLISRDTGKADPRVKQLFRRYRENPDYYYLQAPINGVMCIDEQDHLLGLFRIKRPKRIAEKANRRIADWIFEKVLVRAQELAQERARLSGVSLEKFITPEAEMVREFILAEEFIAQSFRESSISLDRDAMTMHDVGAMKIVADKDALLGLEKSLTEIPDIAVVRREEFSGDYQATNLVLELTCDTESICRKYRDGSSWEKYRDRGIPESDLRKGLEPFLADAEQRINVELILSTFSDLVESEFGNSIHEERILAQRENKRYKGYIPINVELLVESLFAVGFSPRTDIDRVPIKLWGRYLPETLSVFIRKLYDMPEDGFFL